MTHRATPLLAAAAIAVSVALGGCGGGGDDQTTSTAASTGTLGANDTTVQLQPRNNPPNEDAALLKRYAVGRGPDGPKLRIGEGDHVTMVLPMR